MPCFLPKEAVYNDKPNKSGKFGLNFHKDKVWAASPEEIICIPCGECIGCIAERGRQWAMRGMHEAQEHDHNCFITLTYSDDCLPDAGSLREEHLKNFWKRLRKAIEPRRIRYFAAGEYGDPRKGERTWNPHYHAIVFGLELDDCIFYTVKKGRTRWKSSLIQRIWSDPESGQSYGDHQVEKEVNFYNMAYVAGYVLKKQLRKEVDYEGREPEFCRMSRGGRQKGSHGIGAEWFRKYSGETYVHDSVVVDGREVRPPKYYDSLLAGVDPARYAELKEQRLQNAKENRNFERRQVKFKMAKKALERKVGEL